MSESVTGNRPPLTAGVDYITASASRPSGIAGLIDLGRELVAEEEAGGCTKRPFTSHGYSGWTAGPVSWGFTGNSCLLRVSGSAAQGVAARVIDCADNVSRLDLQVTASSDAVGPDYPIGLYARLASARGGRGRTATRSLIQQSDGGCGFYLGRRASDQFGRVYNKSAEEQVYEIPPRIRFEVEFKRSYALGSARAFRAAVDPSRHVVNHVATWFGTRGVNPPFDPAGPVVGPVVARRESDRDRRLRWLAVGVAPVLRGLADELGWHELAPRLGIPLAILRDPTAIAKLAEG